MVVLARGFRQWHKTRAEDVEGFAPRLRFFANLSLPKPFTVTFFMSAAC